MLQEWYQRGADTDNLISGDVHELYFIRTLYHVFLTVSGLDLTIDELIILVQPGICLSYDVFILFISGEILYLR
ncbi:MAG: hypothetical protein DDT27_00146 [Dehalococcoidia bacterium]|nr:hypothetical protein [Chloroflexota bacterium]